MEKVNVNTKSFMELAANAPAANVIDISAISLFCIYISHQSQLAGIPNSF